jgi:hypothetical protein
LVSARHQRPVQGQTCAEQQSSGGDQGQQHSRAGARR